jgi:1,4-alpha-glucan branching enzyme
MKTLSKSKKQPDAQKESGISLQPDNFRIKKKYLKTKPLCKVKFTLPKDAAPNARSVTIVGDFNKWNPSANQLKALKNGNYTITLDLERGEYCFRYLIDGCKWENDWHADKYVPNSFGCDNSVVVL